ncbi:MAG: glycerophosphodiester phosphodiesterase [Betaproteobacteria bacterium]|nr:glycerophosphodiester phosphodiesterase [Betaproteobacteria bacterium]
MRRTLVAALLAAAAAAEAQAADFNTLTGAAPIVIGHRGASGYRPEHTLASYDLAISMGANYIEPDLVSTKDGVLVARHENALAIVNPVSGAVIEATTNVNELVQFADRKATKTIDGVTVTGWFTEDFTLAELKTLRARERIPAIRPGNTAYNDQFEIPTLQEVIDLAKQRSAELGRPIGIYPETKHPTYFDSIGLSLEEKLVEALHANYGNTSTAPVFIQSFEVANLKELNGMTDISIVQLINAGGRPWDFTVAGDSRTYADMASAAGLDEIATYADGVGVNKTLMIPRNGDGTLGDPTSVIADAHAEGLIVHGWTFRRENTFLPTDYRAGSDPNAYGDLEGEILAFFAAGMDGVFSDQPDIGVAAVASIPEPQTYALMLGGLGILGAVARRRARR